MVALGPTSVGKSPAGDARVKIGEDGRWGGSLEFYYRGVDRDVLILRADGGIDATNAHEFLSELSRLIEGGIRKMIVDCSGLEHISSSGVATLVRLHRRLWAVGGQVKLAALTGPVFRLLEVTKLAELFDIYPSVDAARNAFREG